MTGGLISDILVSEQAPYLENSKVYTFTAKDAGVYGIEIQEASNPNYALPANVSAQMIINKRVLGVDWTGVISRYTYDRTQKSAEIINLDNVISDDEVILVYDNSGEA